MLEIIKTLIVLLLGSAIVGGILPAHASSFGTIFTFNISNGAGPGGGVISVGGLLYGLTANGGAGGYGTIYSLDPATGAEKVVYSFMDGSDGAIPTAVIAFGKTLFVATDLGGSINCGCGTIVAFNLGKGTERTVHTFLGGKDGANPSFLINIAGTLYGTTEYGGRGHGTIFTLDANTAAEKIVYSFKGGRDGSLPMSLIDVDGILYGNTYVGGSQNCQMAGFDPGCGTLFSFDLKNGDEQVLHTFLMKTGAYPTGMLTLIGGNLYGTTSNGGASEDGTVFDYDLTSEKTTVSYAFKGGTDGAAPFGGLLYDGGALYGTTTAGGGGDCPGDYSPPGCGTLFSIKPGANSVDILYSFQNGPDGASPAGSLINVGGTFYGTTAGLPYINAPASYGTVFFFARR